MHKITGVLHTHDLTGEAKNGRKFISTVVNYGLLRQYTEKNVYDPFAASGNQREVRQRHAKKIREALSAGEYTPQAFNVSVSNLSNVEVNGRNVTIPLTDDTKLSLLNGGHRQYALEEIRAAGGTTTRLVDNLPIPVLVYLDGDNAKDFVNLNQNLNIDKSHLLSMQIDGGCVTGDKYETYVRSKVLCQLFHTYEDSPIKGLVSFGADGKGSLAFRVLCSSRLGDQPSNLFGTAKILAKLEKSNDDWINVLLNVNKYISEHTTCGEAGKLLCLPPNGPKGAVYNLIGVVNCWMYYLYLQNRSNPEPADYKLLANALSVYDDEVSGDMSARRRSTLLGAFAQNLFQPIADDPDHPAGTHFGIPLSLLALAGHSGFATEKPPKPIGERKKRGRKPREDVVVEDASVNVQPTDQDEEWND